jgi:hypothetical protein
MDGVDGRRRWRSGTRGSAVTYVGRRWRGEAAGNRSTRRRKRVSVVAAQRRTGGAAAQQGGTAVSSNSGGGTWLRTTGGDAVLGHAGEAARCRIGAVGVAREVR